MTVDALPAASAGVAGSPNASPVRARPGPGAASWCGPAARLQVQPVKGGAVLKKGAVRVAFPNKEKAVQAMRYVRARSRPTGDPRHCRD